MELHIQSTKLAKERVIEVCGIKVIVDDVLLYERDDKPLLH